MQWILEFVPLTLPALGILHFGLVINFLVQGKQRPLPSGTLVALTATNRLQVLVPAPIMQRPTYDLNDHLYLFLSSDSLADTHFERRASSFRFNREGRKKREHDEPEEIQKTSRPYQNVPALWLYCPVSLFFFPLREHSSPFPRLTTSFNPNHSVPLFSPLILPSCLFVLFSSIPPSSSSAAGRLPKCLATPFTWDRRQGILPEALRIHQRHASFRLLPIDHFIAL